MRRLLVIAAVVCSLAGVCVRSARAAAPDIDYLFPSGGQRGDTFKLTAGTKADAKIATWPAKVWIDCPGVEFAPTDTAGQFEVCIAPDAPLGPHLLRIFNDDGVSPPRVFVVGRYPEINEKEPNDSVETAQPVKDLPAVVNGTLDKTGDADCYAVDVEAGKWLVAELQCRRLGSPCDPALRLLDPGGVVVAFNHDTYGLDPLIAYRVSRAGRYVIQIVAFAYPPGSEIRFEGSKSTVYRLSVTTGPYARFAFPPCAQRDCKSTIKLYGWNLGPDDADAFKKPLEVEIDPTQVPVSQDHFVLAPAAIDNVIRLPLIGSVKQWDQIEAELDGAPRIPEPPLVTVDGRIESPGAVERVAFEAKDNERFTLSVMADSLNSPVDPMLVVSGPTGAELVRDVGAGQDIRIDWTASKAGRYTVSLSDIHRGCGAEYVYHMEIDRASPDYTATVDAPSYRVEAGKTANIQVTIKRRNGHNTPLKIDTSELPPGVSASAPEVPAGGGAVTLTLSAVAGAEPANVPLRISVRPTHADQADTHIAGFVPGDDVLTLATETLWLTVAPKATEPAPEKKKKE